MSEHSFRWMWHEAVFSKHGPKPVSRGEGLSASTLRAVCGALFGFMNSQGEVPPVRPEVLLETAGVTKPTMIACRAWLEAHGWIESVVAGHTGQGWKRLRYNAQIPPAVFEAMHKVPTREPGKAALPGRKQGGQTVEPRRREISGGGQAALPEVVKQLDHSSSGLLFDDPPSLVVVVQDSPDVAGSADDHHHRDQVDLEGGDGKRSGGTGGDPAREAAVAAMAELTNTWLAKPGRLPPRGHPDRPGAITSWDDELRPLLEDAGAAPHEKWAHPRTGEPLAWELRPAAWERALGYRGSGRSPHIGAAVRLALLELHDHDSPRQRTPAGGGGGVTDGWAVAASILPPGAAIDDSVRRELADDIRSWCREHPADAEELARAAVAGSGAQGPRETHGRFAADALRRIRGAPPPAARVGSPELEPVGQALTAGLRQAGFKPP